jgi:hypothetical protein
MTDQELLELAAKAAGQERSVAGELWSNARGLPWNPLADDGDALRLAVNLGVDVVQFTGCVRVDVAGGADVYEKHDGDPCAATRRAIVRAAAAMAPLEETASVRNSGSPS